MTSVISYTKSLLEAYTPFSSTGRSVISNVMPLSNLNVLPSFFDVSLSVPSLNVLLLPVAGFNSNVNSPFSILRPVSVLVPPSLIVIGSGLYVFSNTRGPAWQSSIAFLPLTSSVYVTDEVPFTAGSAVITGVTLSLPVPGSVTVTVTVYTVVS